MPAISANATRPSLVASATTTVRFARSISTRLVAASTSFCVVSPRSASTPSTPTNAMST
jgi:hypothetical protein